MTKTKTKQISVATRAAILEAVWQLLADGRASLRLAEVASAAGVSRQTVFYAFGDRAGLLKAALRHRDESLPHVGQLRAIVVAGDGTADRLLEFTALWLDYIPHVYPVASLLHAAAASDRAAREAINDRLNGALLSGFRSLVSAYAERFELPEGRTPQTAADEIWSACHIETWRLLVVESGWTAAAFRQSRLALVRCIIGL